MRLFLVILAMTFVISLHFEVTHGRSIWGCFLRGIYGIDGSVCQ